MTDDELRHLWCLAEAKAERMSLALEKACEYIAWFAGHVDESREIAYWRDRFTSQADNERR